MDIGNVKAHCMLVVINLENLLSRQGRVVNHLKRGARVSDVCETIERQIAICNTVCVGLNTAFIERREE